MNQITVFSLGILLLHLLCAKQPGYVQHLEGSSIYNEVYESRARIDRPELKAMPDWLDVKTAM